VGGKLVPRHGTDKEKKKGGGERNRHHCRPRRKKTQTGRLTAKKKGPGYDVEGKKKKRSRLLRTGKKETPDGDAKEKAQTKTATEGKALLV